MSKQVRREELRLRRVFERVFLIAGATTAIAVPAACSSGGNGSSAGPGGGGGAGGAASSSSSTTSSGGGTTSSSSTTSSGGGTTSSSSTTSSGGEGDAGPVSCDPVAVTPDPPDSCGNYMHFPCGLPADYTVAENCYLTLSDCSKFCPGNYFNCHVVECTDAGTVGSDPQGGVTVDCSTCPKGVGRVPAGLARARTRRAPSAIGDYFAAAAHLEAASVHAFRRLRGELGAHRAPARLIRAARAAEQDEVRHARVTARLARRFGGSPAAPRVASLPPRSLDAIALENAVEGCVRETFGALLATYQAAHAEDAEIARAMESIARDETRHAALSWAVGRWAWRRLDAPARARIAAACREAVAALRREADAPLDADLAGRAGLPSASQQRALLDSLDAHLWRSFAAGEGAAELAA